MPVIVDSREPEKIKKVLRLHGIKHEVRQLETGDVICISDKNPDVEIVIERKRIDDMVSSYIDKRMDTQFERLSRKRFAILIITGDIKKIQYKYPFKIMPNFVSEVISKAVIQYNFRSVIWLLEGMDDVNGEAFALMVKSINLVIKNQLDEVPERHVKTAKDPRVDSLKKTLGLNSKVCIKLLKKYGSVLEVLQLKDSHFLSIAGIGPAHVKRIRFTLSTNYSSKKAIIAKPSIIDVGNITGEKCKICGAEMKMKHTVIGIVRICSRLPHGPV